MQKQKKTSDKTEEEFEPLPETDTADHSVLDKLLDEIDELLAEEDRRLYKEKLKSIGFIARRAPDPCANVIRVPEYMAEALLRSGIGRESKAGGCCDDCG